MRRLRKYEIDLISHLQLAMDLRSSKNQKAWDRSLKASAISRLTHLHTVDLVINYGVGLAEELFENRVIAIALDNICGSNGMECVARLAVLPLKSVKIEIKSEKLSR